MGFYSTNILPRHKYNTKMASFGAESWAKFQGFGSGSSPISSGSGMEGTGSRFPPWMKGDGDDCQLKSMPRCSALNIRAIWEKRRL